MPKHIEIAKKYLGVKEIVGPKHNLTITGWAARIAKKFPKQFGWTGKLFSKDETPWCGLFVAQVMDEAGFPLPQAWPSANGWSLYGHFMNPERPRLGAILVFTRNGGGHVGFYVGEDAKHFFVLGGNQSNAVTITRLAKSRLSAVRWPPNLIIPEYKGPLKFTGATNISTNEA